ncbi:MAG: hypothetical protein IGR93_13580 [Hydrococcus sp. C42_A2020_068]|nr:hypothetical protein [Hydrococcus sp. C42_A2020_068]
MGRFIVEVGSRGRWGVREVWGVWKVWGEFGDSEDKGTGRLGVWEDN